MTATSSAAVTGLAGLKQRGRGTVLDTVRTKLGRYIGVLDGRDLDIVTLWCAHTHAAEVLYTSPRLVIDSPIPESGKTTLLEWIGRLSRDPLQAASLSSPALLARLLAQRIRTVLIDEADRNLNPKKPGVEDLIAVINSGYKQGATRPVLVPAKGGSWDVDEMPTYAPLVMAGNNPDLPADTVSRTIRVLLLPDHTVEVTDWEVLDDEVRALGSDLRDWVEHHKAQIKVVRPELPGECVGRTRERWAPLRRVAEVAQGDWPTVCNDLILRDIATAKADREDGVGRTPTAVTLLHHLAQVWPDDKRFLPTEYVCAYLAGRYPDVWGTGSPFGKPINPQRLGRMLAHSFKVNTIRVQEDNGSRSRGYLRDSLIPVWRRMGVPLPNRPDKPADCGQSGQTP